MFGIETIQEVVAVFKLYFSSTRQKRDGNGEFCYRSLDKTSRSFATVIQQLPPDLQDPVCIFYIVLRALDTIEDDPTLKAEAKIPLLKKFHETIEKPGTVLTGYNTSKHGELMDNFDRVIEVYGNLKDKYRKVIKNITNKMGNGMCVYLEKEVVTLKDYDEYCYYVAGTVGEGLTDMFSLSYYPDNKIKNELSVSMGLFLQKTNITRDFEEDIREDRTFWPRAIWEKHAKELIDLTKPENRKEAVKCLNMMILNAMEHIPDCMEYMERLAPVGGKPEQVGVWKFCAVPQVMAIATLAECFDNPKVFEVGAVKIRKGTTARLFVETTNMTELKKIFAHYVKIIKSRITSDNVLNYVQNLEKCSNILKSIELKEQFSTGTSLVKVLSYSATIAFSSFCVYLKRDYINEQIKKLLKK